MGLEAQSSSQDRSSQQPLRGPALLSSLGQCDPNPLFGFASAYPELEAAVRGRGLIQGLVCAEGLATGDSLAVNGCCLTLTERGPEDGELYFDLLAETLRLTNLGALQEGDLVNLERALRVGSVDRIIAAADIRPYVIDALERGIARHV